jgi:hypothetical protein
MKQEESRMSMNTAKEREASFRAGLKRLLDDHGAEIETTDDDTAHGLHKPVTRITMMSVYNSGYEKQAEFCEFDL